MSRWQTQVRAALAGVLSLAVGAAVLLPAPAEAADTAGYISLVAPLAQKEYATYGVPASVAIAQSILESGWGASGLTKEANNYFGIKCPSSGNPANTGSPYVTGCVAKDSYEYPGPVLIRSWFRAYGSRQGSFLDHGLLLSSRSWYSPAFRYSDNPDQFIREIAKGGYATDPSYADLVIRLMRQYNLYRFDAKPSPTPPPTPPVTPTPSLTVTPAPTMTATAKPSVTPTPTVTPTAPGSARPSAPATTAPAPSATGPTPAGPTTAAASAVASAAPVASTTPTAPAPTGRVTATVSVTPTVSSAPVVSPTPTTLTPSVTTSSATPLPTLTYVAPAAVQSPTAGPSTAARATTPAAVRTTTATIATATTTATKKASTAPVPLAAPEPTLVALAATVPDLNGPQAALVRLVIRTDVIRPDPVATRWMAWMY